LPSEELLEKNWSWEVREFGGEPKKGGSLHARRTQNQVPGKEKLGEKIGIPRKRAEREFIIEAKVLLVIEETCGNWGGREKVGGQERCLKGTAGLHIRRTQIL